MFQDLPTAKRGADKPTTLPLSLPWVYQIRPQPMSHGESCTGLHNSFHPTIRDGSTWSKFGARGEHGDVFLFSNLGAL